VLYRIDFFLITKFWHTSSDWWSFLQKDICFYFDFRKTNSRCIYL